MATRRKAAEPKGVDIFTMNLEELVAHRQDVDDRINALKEEAITALREEFQKKAASLGLSINEVVGVPTKDSSNRKKRSDAGVKQEPYYRNPDDHTQVAYLKGKKPGWMTELLESGTDIEDLKIENQ